MKAASEAKSSTHCKCSWFYGKSDYEYGWGLVNGKEAAKLILNNVSKSIFKEKKLINGLHKNFSINTIQPLSVYNIDPDGVKTDSGVEDSRTPILINNLDLKLIKDRVVFYPEIKP
jgi:hypothetical protein